LGRPLLSKDLVSVKAVVIEKTTTAAEIDYDKVSGKKITFLSCRFRLEGLIYECSRAQS
jgi:hypothetical protein